MYNGECVKHCPENTINNNYICTINKEDEDECSISEKKLDNIDLEINKNIEIFVKQYLEEYDNTDKHISLYKNNQFSLMILKLSSCILDLSLKISDIDFGKCYNRTKEIYNIEEDLVIAIIENYKKVINYRPTISFWFLNPLSGKVLDLQNICMNETIKINQNIESILNNTDNNDNLEMQIELLKNDINIFDPNDEFYSDLCFYFISPIKKDIPLKDRLQEFYPNITLCNSGCKNIGINSTTKSAICECKYSDLLNSANNDFLEETTTEILNIVEKSNVEVVKCVVKSLKHFKENYGGFIVRKAAPKITCKVPFFAVIAKNSF